MEVLGSALDDQRSRAPAMAALVEDLHRQLAGAALGGPARSRQKHVARGKLLPRQRVDRLIDTGTPFLELAPLAAHGMYDDAAPAAGLIAGIGMVAGRHCLILSNDATVKGGTYFPMTVKKHLRAQEVAEQNRLPCLYLVCSGSAFLLMQDEVVPRRFHVGRIFYNLARSAATGIAQSSAVMWSSPAASVSVPAMCVQTVIVRE